MNRSRFFIQSLGMGLVIGAVQPAVAEEPMQFARGPEQRAEQPRVPAEQREEIRARRQAEAARRAASPEGEDRRQFRQEMRSARERVYGPPKRRGDR